MAEARRGGELLAEADVLPDVVHTSLQRRAIHTAQHALDTMGRDWIPVRRHWRLNERHYGDLQGKDKKQVGEEHGPTRSRSGGAPMTPRPRRWRGTTSATPASTPATPTSPPS